MSHERSETEEQATDEERSPEEQSAGQSEERPEGEADGDDGSDGDGQSATEGIDEQEDPKAVVEKLEEEGPPQNLEDWPQGKAKYETFGGPEGEHAYDEGPEEQLGPSSLRHHEDGKVSIAGEEVDEADEYKGEPIPGGPTDPEAEDDSVSAKTKVKMEQEGADFGEASSDKMDNPYIKEAREKAGAESGDGESGDSGDGDQGSDQEGSAEQEERQEA